MQPDEFLKRLKLQIADAQKAAEEKRPSLQELIHSVETYIAPYVSGLSELGIKVELQTNPGLLFKMYYSDEEYCGFQLRDGCLKEIWSIRGSFNINEDRGLDIRTCQNQEVFDDFVQELIDNFNGQSDKHGGYQQKK